MMNRRHAVQALAAAPLLGVFAGKGSATPALPEPRRESRKDVVVLCPHTLVPYRTVGSTPVEVTYVRTPAGHLVEQVRATEKQLVVQSMEPQLNFTHEFFLYDAEGVKMIPNSWIRVFRVPGFYSVTAVRLAPDGPMSITSEAKGSVLGTPFTKIGVPSPGCGHMVTVTPYFNNTSPKPYYQLYNLFCGQSLPTITLPYARQHVVIDSLTGIPYAFTIRDETAG